MARGRNKYGWTGAMEKVIIKLNELDRFMQEHAEEWQLDAQMVAKYHTLATNANKLYEDCKKSNLNTPALRTKRHMAILLAQNFVKDVRPAIYANHRILDDVVVSMGFAPRRRPHAGKTANITARPDIKAWMASSLLLSVTVNKHTDDADVTHHGWPEKAPFALIHVTDPNGNLILSKFTTHRHNHIPISSALYNKYLLVSAAYLAHVDDDPPHAFCEPVAVYVVKGYYDSSETEAKNAHGQL